MIKSIISVLASAIGIAGYSVVPPPAPIPPNCIPTHVRDVPGYTCPVYNPVLNRFVYGPFVPYQPYVDVALNHQKQWNSYLTEYVGNVHAWQLGEFDRYKTFLDASPWPKPYGFDAFYENQKEWLEFHQKMEDVNIQRMNDAREHFLNWNAGNGNQ